MDINDFRTVATVLVFLTFMGIAWWAYGPSRKGYFDEAAQLPFQDDDDAPANTTHNKGEQA